MLIRKRTYNIVLLLATLAGTAAYAQEQPFVVERAPFSNRSYNEYSPILYNGNIIIRSDKRLNAKTKNSDENDNTAMNIFIVRDLGKGEWSDPQLFASELSGNKQHYGPAIFNDQGNRIWFNRMNDESDQDRTKIGIFSGGYAGGEWTSIQPFRYNDPRYDFMHPFLSEDGRMLFFASNMPGGLGLFDLYVCYLRGKLWSEPVNLGPNINTNRNEIYPVYYSDGRLYFSSQGLDPNLGGFDLYYSTREVGEWSPPVHLAPPFNSRRNEAWFYLTDTSYTRGYIHSNREARIYNIFEFTLDIPEDLYEDCKLVEQNSYCFTFYEAGTMDIDTTQYRYEWVIEDKKFRQEEVDYCFIGIGKYTIALNVIDMLSGEVLFNEATYELDIEDIEQVYISSPDTVYVNDPVRF
ncbi:MAG: PD40 domain-containing protein, partial [Bacteroidales bacterium]|nr:PD40 domain-containing protein [Bacteroidales bacterium]